MGEARFTQTEIDRAWWSAIESNLAFDALKSLKDPNVLDVSEPEIETVSPYIFMAPYELPIDNARRHMKALSVVNYVARTRHAIKLDTAQQRFENSSTAAGVVMRPANGTPSPFELPK